jgi:Tol biopolymer transport system component
MLFSRMTSTSRLQRLSFAFLALAGFPTSALEVSPLVLESRSFVGGPATGPCAAPFLSTTGRYITFACTSDDVVVGDVNERSDTFIVDRNVGTVDRVSLDSNEVSYRFNSGGGFPSVDGRYVVFTSAAPLHPDLTFPYTGFGYGNPFLRDRLLGSTELLGRSSTGTFAPQTGAAQLAGVSFNRNLVLFSSSSNMIDSAIPPVPRPVQLYVRNWLTGLVTLVTRTPSGQFSVTGASGGSAFSPNGRFVAFMSTASDLNDENQAGTDQLMIHDLESRVTRRLSYPGTGGEFTGTPYYQAKAGSFSADGQLLVVEANSDELGPGDAIGLSDVYVIDTRTGRYELISTGFGGDRPNNASFEPSISADGRYVVFFSRASNLLSTPQYPAVYVKDRWTGELKNISEELGAPRSNYIPLTAISADSSTIAFDWRHPDAAPIVGSRTLVYSTRFRGSPTGSVVAVPATNLVAMLLYLVAIVAIGAYLANRRTGEA